MSAGIYTLEEIGQKLVEAALISIDQLAVALETKKNRGGNLGRILVRRGFVTEDQLIDFFENFLKIPIVSLKDFPISPDVTKTVPISLAQQYRFMPLSHKGNTLKIAISNAIDIFFVDDISFALKMRIQPVLADSSEVRKLLEDGYRLMEFSEENLEDVEYVNLEVEEESKGAKEDLTKMASGTKIVAEVNRIISNAVINRASDIHIEPLEKSVKLRYRIDGLLEERMILHKRMHLPILTRIKIISGMDIAERRIPQDGRVRLKVQGKLVDMRVSTYPTMHGEKVVIRLLTQESILSLEDLGFSERDKKSFEKVITAPHGVFLVTGPTGSGKTTTLYAALQRINSQDRNIISVEDPIENEIVGVNQAQVNTKAGLTFASALRSILRQDPDVIMVGEIRDHETADIVVRSAITGHLVFSTLHTNTAIGAVTRLIDLGVERFLISSAVIGLLSQRLVRRICSHCKEQVDVNDVERKNLGLESSVNVYKGRGCRDCNMSGYSGRIALFELVYIDNQLREMILNGTGEAEMMAIAKKQGTVDVYHSGIQKVKEGLTTIEEVLRVLKD